MLFCLLCCLPFITKNAEFKSDSPLFAKTRCPVKAVITSFWCCRDTQASLIIHQGKHDGAFCSLIQQERQAKSSFERRCIIWSRLPAQGREWKDKLEQKAILCQQSKNIVCAHDAHDVDVISGRVQCCGYKRTDDFLPWTGNIVTPKTLSLSPAIRYHQRLYDAGHTLHGLA